MLICGTETQQTLETSTVFILPKINKLKSVRSIKEAQMFAENQAYLTKMFQTDE